MNRATRDRRRNGESGQVLILAVVAMILIVIAALLLFDVQTVIRGKVKAQNAVDAAALTAAEWQKHSLNVIGELNMYRATGALISEPFFRIGVLNDPNTNDGELYGELENAWEKINIPDGDFARFPNAGDYFDQDGKFILARYDDFTDELIRIEKERRFLMATDRLISQMQTRLAFAGPLIAFGAAQKAAEANGLLRDTDAGESLAEYRIILADKVNELWNDQDYYNDDAFGYFWGSPYVSMLNSIQDAGLYVGTRFTFSGMPELVSDSAHVLAYYLGRNDTYYNILRRNWPALRPLLEYDFSDNWWNNLRSVEKRDYTYQSDLLPLHIDFSTSRNPYDKAAKINAFEKYDHWKQRGFEGYIGDYFNDEDPVEYIVEAIPGEVTTDEVTGERHYSTRYEVGPISDADGNPVEPYFIYHDEDADMRYNVLPTLTWALFDSDWRTYSDDFREEWETKMLRGHFKDGTDCQAGARAYFSASQDTAPALLTGSMGQKKRNGNARNNRRVPRSRFEPNVGDVFSQIEPSDDYMAALYGMGLAGDGFVPARRNYDAHQAAEQLRLLENSRFLQKIQTDALAKPVGILKVKGERDQPPFAAGRMVLPVFDDTALIPRSLEPVYGVSLSEKGWLYSQIDFLPELYDSPTLEEAFDRAREKHPERWLDYMPYYLALRMLNDPNFRKEGLDWLDKHKDDTYEPADNGNEFKLH